MTNDSKQLSQEELKKIWQDFNAEVEAIRRDQRQAIKAFTKRLVDKKIEGIHHTLERAYAKSSGT